MSNKCFHCDNDYNEKQDPLLATQSNIRQKINEVTFEESNGTLPKLEVNGSRRKRNYSVGSNASSSNNNNNNNVGRSKSSNGYDVRVVAPDGGWGWVVVFASFMINLICDGISLSFGVIFMELVSYFGESKSKTAWVGSLFFSIPLITGPIASTLTDHFGCRRVAITGALLSASGFILGHFSYKLEHLFIAFSLSGFGLALCYVTSIVIVAYYFETKRSLATGLAVCGTGFGTFLFAPLIIFLLQEYGWRGTLLILAGIFLNIIIFGALMRDLHFHENKSLTDDAENNTICDIDESQAASLPLNVNDSVITDAHNNDTNQDRLFSSLVHIPTYMHHRDSNFASAEVISELSCRKGGYLRRLMQRYPKLIIAFMANESDKNDLTIKSLPSTSNTLEDKPLSILFKNDKIWTLSPPSKSTAKSLSKRENNPDATQKNNLLLPQNEPSPLSSHCLRNLKLQRGSLTYRSAMLNIRKYRLKASSAPDIYRNSMVTIEEKNCGILYDLKDILLDMVNLSNFKSFRYSLFCLSNFLLYACVDVAYVYIPDQAISSGAADKESASFLISIIGILNTLGVVLVGYIGDKPWIDASILYSGFIAISGISMGIIPWICNYVGIALLAAIYGFTISANYALVSVILVDLISLDSFTNAYGLLLLVQGFGSLVGPPIAGWLYDISGNYDSAFYITGVCIFISGALMAPVAKSSYCFTIEDNTTIATDSSRPCSPDHFKLTNSLDFIPTEFKDNQRISQDLNLLIVNDSISCNGSVAY